MTQDEHQVKWNILKNSVYSQLPRYEPLKEKIRLLGMILYEKVFNLFGLITK